MHKEAVMLQVLSRWIESVFGPVFELLGNVPPRYVNRLFAPF
jgi:hypothetical protein